MITIITLADWVAISAVFIFIALLGLAQLMDVVSYVTGNIISWYDSLDILGRKRRRTIKK